MQNLLITPPLATPISLAEAKLHLRVDHVADDALITNLIDSCYEMVERYLDMSLIEQTWQWTFDRWSEVAKFKTDAGRKATPYALTAGHYVSIPRKPLISVDSIKTYDENDVSVVWDPSNIIVDKGEGRIYLKTGSSWPQVGKQVTGIEITYKSGFGLNSGDVPAPIRQAILQMLAYYYQQRDLASSEPAALIPSAAIAMLTPFKAPRI